MLSAAFAFNALSQLIKQEQTCNIQFFLKKNLRLRLLTDDLLVPSVKQQLVDLVAGADVARLQAQLHRGGEVVAVVGAPVRKGREEGFQAEGRTQALVYDCMHLFFVFVTRPFAEAEMLGLFQRILTAF